MNSLKNKVIVVTGGKGLIGGAFVRELRNANAEVVIVDIQADEKSPGEIACDVTNLESVKQLVQKVVAQYGKIDGWINNAYPRTKDWGKENFDDESMESWRQNVDMHLVGYAICCQAALNQMKLQQFGSLINLASIYGINGPDFSIYENTTIKNPSAYAAIKGGLITLTRYLAAYYGPFNVRVNCISPGGIFDHQPASFVNNYEKKTPLRRLGKPGDIAPAATFLLSDSASYITGHNLVIDGGWTIV